MSKLTARLEALENQRGPLRCWVSFGDGPYKSFNEATGKTDELTEAEVDALPGDNRKIHVTYVPMNLNQDERTAENE